MHMDNNCNNINEFMINLGGQPEESHTRLICCCVWYNNSYLGQVGTHLSRLSGNSKIATIFLPEPWKAMIAAASVNGSTEVSGVATFAERHSGDLLRQQKLHPLIASTLPAGAAN